MSSEWHLEPRSLIRKHPFPVETLPNMGERISHAFTIYLFISNLVLIYSKSEVIMTRYTATIYTMSLLSS